MSKLQSKGKENSTGQKCKGSDPRVTSDVSHLTIHQIFHKVKSGIVRGVTKIKTMKTKNSTDSDSPSSNLEGKLKSGSCGAFESMLEKDQRKELIAQIRQALSAVQENSLGAQILVPCGLISKISQDVMNMARSEPCGVRGCAIYINLQGKSKCQKLVKLVCDPTTVATFELYLTLEEETRGWCMFKRLFISVSGCLEKKPWSSGVTMLCSGYNLEKKKLYRSN